jgi:energy-coupling factor transport system permease protein
MQINYQIPDSFLEKLHPITKLLFLLFIIFATIVFSELILVICIGGLVVLWMLMGNQLKKLSILLLFFVAIALSVITILYFLTGGGTNTELSIISFIKMFSHIFCGLSIALSTSPRKIASLMQALKVPKHFLFVFIVTLRFLPVMIAEYSSIRNALKLRGQKTVKLLFLRPGLIVFPIIVRAVKLSDELALSAETRGFSIYNLRFPVEPARFSFRDILVYSGMLISLIALFLQKQGMLI